MIVKVRKRYISLALMLIMIVMSIVASGCGDTGKKEPFDIMKYNNTYWTKESTDWSKGGYILYVNADYKADRVIIDLSYTRGEPNPQDTEIQVIKKMSEITDKEVTFSFDKDSWGKSGDVKIVFNGDKIDYVISNVKDSEGGAKWGFFNDEGSLVKHENPGKELMEHNQKAYQSNQTTPEQTNSAANSAIFAHNLMHNIPLGSYYDVAEAACGAKGHVIEESSLHAYIRWYADNGFIEMHYGSDDKLNEISLSDDIVFDLTQMNPIPNGSRDGLKKAIKHNMSYEQVQSIIGQPGILELKGSNVHDGAYTRYVWCDTRGRGIKVIFKDNRVKYTNEYWHSPRR